MVEFQFPSIISAGGIISAGMGGFQSPGPIEASPPTQAPGSVPAGGGPVQVPSAFIVPAGGGPVQVPAAAASVPVGGPVQVPGAVASAAAGPVQVPSAVWSLAVPKSRAITLAFCISLDKV